MRGAVLIGPGVEENWYEKHVLRHQKGYRVCAQMLHGVGGAPAQLSQKVFVFVLFRGASEKVSARVCRKLSTKFELYYETKLYRQKLPQGMDIIV